MTVQGSERQEKWFARKRELAEQIVGFAIITAICIVLAFSGPRPRFGSFMEIFLLAHVSAGAGFWTLWREISMRALKLELALFISTFLFEIIWIIGIAQSLPALYLLISLFLWFCSAVCCFALFWKKKKIAALCFTPLLLWILAQVAVNLVLSMINY